MKEWQHRVMQERDDLDVKVIKLSEFLNADAHALDVYDVDLLGKQLTYMNGYLSILNHRINCFFDDEELKHDTTGI